MDKNVSSAVERMITRDVNANRAVELDYYIKRHIVLVQFRSGIIGKTLYNLETGAKLEVGTYASCYMIDDYIIVSSINDIVRLYDLDFTELDSGKLSGDIGALFVYNYMSKQIKDTYEKEVDGEIIVARSEISNSVIPFGTFGHKLDKVAFAEKMADIISDNIGQIADITLESGFSNRNKMFLSAEKMYKTKSENTKQILNEVGNYIKLIFNASTYIQEITEYSRYILLGIKIDQKTLSYADKYILILRKDPLKQIITEEKPIISTDEEYIFTRDNNKYNNESAYNSDLDKIQKMIKFNQFKNLDLVERERLITRNLDEVGNEKYEPIVINIKDIPKHINALNRDDKTCRFIEGLVSTNIIVYDDSSDNSIDIVINGFKSLAIDKVADRTLFDSVSKTIFYLDETEQVVIGYKTIKANLNSYIDRMYELNNTTYKVLSKSRWEVYSLRVEKANSLDSYLIIRNIISKNIYAYSFNNKTIYKADISNINCMPSEIISELSEHSKELVDRFEYCLKKNDSRIDAQDNLLNIHYVDQSNIPIQVRCLGLAVDHIEMKKSETRSTWSKKLGRQKGSLISLGRAELYLSTVESPILHHMNDIVKDMDIRRKELNLHIDFSKALTSKEIDNIESEFEQRMTKRSND